MSNTAANSGNHPQYLGAMYVNGRDLAIANPAPIKNPARLSEIVGTIPMGTPADANVAIEAAHADYWYKYVGLEGRVIGMTTYGESAPAPALFEEFGFTLENILGQAEELLEEGRLF